MTTTPGLQNYLNHLYSSLPGGVECGYCHQVDTYGHVSLQWNDLGGDNYSFRQVVRCDRCGYKHGYQWEQRVKPDFGVRIHSNVQVEGSNNA